MASTKKKSKQPKKLPPDPRSKVRQHRERAMTEAMEKRVLAMKHQVPPPSLDSLRSTLEVNIRKARGLDREAREIKSMMRELAPYVEHPAHYNKGRFEVIDVLDDWEYAGMIGSLAWNAIKYLSRSRLKGEELENIEKALFYVRRLRDNVKREQEG